LSFRKVELKTERWPMVTVHNLDHESVAKMIQLDLASLDREPESRIGNFSFHGCTGGVAAFKGQPPWEYHDQGDELLFILAGESELTVLEEDSRSVWTFQQAIWRSFQGVVGTPTTHPAE
jgi:hypothetical protein